jgi:hypothetical protein
MTRHCILTVPTVPAVPRPTRHARRANARAAQSARDVRNARMRHAWWAMQTAEARRHAYYVTMRECYGMTAQEALQQTRRFHDAFGPAFDLIGSMKEALRHA